jgi:hypothetical protein
LLVLSKQIGAIGDQAQAVAGMKESTKAIRFLETLPTSRAASDRDNSVWLPQLILHTQQGDGYQLAKYPFFVRGGGSKSDTSKDRDRIEVLKTRTHNSEISRSKATNCKVY